MRQLISGAQVRRANGDPIPGVRVNVYVASTGDTTGLQVPAVTIIAAAYDAAGTRHVRRLDLRRESLSRYALFAESFPSGQTHGPGVVLGRVHTNETWRGSSSSNTYRDTLSALAAVTGTGTFDIDSVVGGARIRFPRDSTFPRLDTLAAAANLSFAPVSGGGRASRLEFVAFDADADSVVEPSEGFVRVFDLASASGVDTTRFRMAPPVNNGFNTTDFSWQNYYRWDHPVVQNQCGAFYFRFGRWHFFPVATHRAGWARNIIQAVGGVYPNVTSDSMDQMNDHDVGAVRRILANQATARCFPAGSPYLVNTERMTNALGVVTGTAADTVPFGIVTPAGGWPASAPNGYGGSDTTFTVRSRTCTISTGSTSGRCNSGTLRDLGSWRAFPGTAVTGVNAAMRQATELPYLWPYSRERNAASRGVVSAQAGPLYVSGTVSGRVTLRVPGRIWIVDRIRYAHDPNDPETDACLDQLGIVASGDVLVVDGLTSRVRRIGEPDASFSWLLQSPHTVRGGSESSFVIHGSLLSTAGTVGAENPSSTQGEVARQLECPEGAGASTRSNGGCLEITGGAAMRTYSGLHASGTAYSGFRYAGAVDRCQATLQRPPFFPLTNRLVVLRSLDVDPAQANSPAKIRAFLMRLKGRAL